MLWSRLIDKHFLSNSEIDLSQDITPNIEDLEVKHSAKWPKVGKYN